MRYGAVNSRCIEGGGKRERRTLNFEPRSEDIYETKQRALVRCGCDVICGGRLH